jgi:hypothetical protein
LVYIAPYAKSQAYLLHDDGTMLHPEPRTATPRLRDVESGELGLDLLGYHVRETTVAFRTLEKLKNINPRINQETRP